MNAENVSVLGQCIALAAEVHARQVYKGYPPWPDQPYILHPLRVMGKVRSPEEKMVAVLHDVLEDSLWGLEDVTALTGVPAAVADALLAITRMPGEDYGAYISRAAVNVLARAVKIEDLADNLAHNPPGRLAARYRKALRALGSGVAR